MILPLSLKAYWGFAGGDGIESTTKIYKSQFVRNLVKYIY